MTETRKPFLSITGDVDDEMLEAMARMKGVPALMASPAMPKPISANREGQGTHAAPAVQPEMSPAEDGPTPRERMSYVKACLPDYALTALKTKAVEDRVSINHILLKALTGMGITIRPEDMVEDGRRLRGKSANNTQAH